MIESHIFSALSTATAVTTLVGQNIFPLLVPPNANGGAYPPSVVYRVISSTSQPTFETSGMNKYRIQFECWAGGYTQAVAIRDAVIATLDGYEDQYFFSYSLSMNDVYEDTLLQYICMAEFYLLSAL